MTRKGLKMLETHVLYGKLETSELFSSINTHGNDF